MSLQLHAYMQQGALASPAMTTVMLQMARTFSRKRVDAFRYRIQQGSIADMSYRFVELRRDMKNGDITDTKKIREKAVTIDWDLHAWSSDAPSDRQYATVDVREGSPDLYFNGKRHMHESFCHAQIWNSYRTLRIMVNQLLLQNEMQSDGPDIDIRSSALSQVRKMSTEICISTSNFIDSPRKYSLSRLCFSS